MTAPARLCNVRDVATAAPDLLRPGVLYRSEAPQALDETPTGLVWPPATVVDLRGERERAGRHPLTGPGTRVVALGLADALAPDARTRNRARSASWTRLYLDVLDVADAWLPPLVDLAATAEGPVLLHCAAGKDRTGIAVALLLTLAGVPRPAVVADYARSADGLSGVHARLDAAAAAAGRIVDPHSGTAPEALGAVLDAVGFAVARGVSASALTRWRSRVRRATSDDRHRLFTAAPGDRGGHHAVVAPE
ncbi:tyrosine-protein phosphatase [Actinomycetospora sp. NBRC 106378]|uniref:tyrosine-protein phosphatase n=1 Tax=Actinomycetospora sp. NBRC 106378 TaxID=3032208 RepID=UPI0024A06558|nr:tyrosine-protein phosphatase [Actinomycetospora sp. NBRC 106378]GLZ52150.1 phosphotyrosine protein phosphatase [Actinomycetospora sp. NBRC 106378]